MTHLPYSKVNNQSGQALLIILLVLSVVLTITLSVVSRSVTDITTSTYQDESVRALNAAEAGVENIIYNIGSYIPGSTVNEDLGNNSAYSATINLAEITTPNQYVFSEKVETGEPVTFWLVSQDIKGNLICNDGTSNLPCVGRTGGGEVSAKVCFGEPGTPDNSSRTPAILISIYYDGNALNPANNVINAGDYSGVQVVTKFYDPNSARIGTSENGAILATKENCNISNESLAFSSNGPGISIGSDVGKRDDNYYMYVPCFSTRGCMLIMRAQLIYNGNTVHPVALKLGTSGGSEYRLPPQGFIIESVGTSADSTRKVKVFRSYLSPPEVFDSSIFSYTGLSK